jgi:hypothetical protein
VLDPILILPVVIAVAKFNVPEVNAPAYDWDDVPFVPPIVKVVELTVLIALFKDVFKVIIDDVFASVDALSITIDDVFAITDVFKFVTEDIFAITDALKEDIDELKEDIDVLNARNDVLNAVIDVLKSFTAVSKLFTLV